MAENKKVQKMTIRCKQPAALKFGVMKDCTEVATHRVPRYFRDGEDLHLCEEHAKLWNQVHFLGPVASPLR